MDGDSFPDEIVEAILLRLPATSLLRFKIVCKLWYSLINDPNFIKLHLHKSSLNLSRQKILLVSFDEFSRTTNYSPIIQSVEASLNADSEVALLHPPPFPGFINNVVCSCNGLVFIENYREIVLWNPTIRKYKRIPRPCLMEENWVSGLGYDFVTDDYKVLYVRVWHQDDRRVLLFSVVSQAWKMIEDIPVPEGFQLYYHKALSLNGTINVMATSIRASELVISFCLADEKFVVSPVLSNQGSFSRLCALFNRVCVSKIVGPDISILSLEKDGESGLLTWTNLMNISNLGSLIENPWRNTHIFICVKEDGNILCRRHCPATHAIVEYNVRNHEIIEFNQVPGNLVTSLLHVDSLVSLRIPWD